MVENVTIQKNQCPICGGVLSQEGMDETTVYYKCVACGHMSTAPIEDVGNAECILKKRELITRIKLGVNDWQSAQWDRLHMDLQDYLVRYETEQTDLQLQMGLIACITKGFNVLDQDRYRQCKNIFKMTEQMYKSHQKVLKSQVNVELSDSVNNYQVFRTKYIQCRNEYRNTKLMWKVLFFVLRRLAFR